MKKKAPRICLLLIVLAPAFGQAQDSAWRLQPAVGSPDWLMIAGSYRLRYEYLDNTFRVLDPGQDELLVSRLRLHVRANGERFYGGFEFEDSRAWLHSALTPVGTDDVNVLEPLRMYVGYRTPELDIQLGRMTMDVGSRRLVSRNRMRNTTNAFTGINVRWTKPDSFGLQAFLTMPVARVPNNLERARLLDNDFELDQEHRERIFWGLYLSDVRLANGLNTDWYLYGIKEDDRPGLPTRNRDFLNAGIRLRRTTDTWAFEIESVIQRGESRATALPSDVTDLDHRAWFVHLEIYRKLAGDWQPRVIFRFDYATGDGDPDDGEFNRFDSLFGDRRWEFGPTGIYGALTRSNILSPGVALRLQPGATVDFRADYRAAWLASDRDFMPTAGLRDRDGQSGSFIGHQLDARYRWQSTTKTVTVEIGAAYLWKGEFLRDAPGAPPDSNTIYAYLSTMLTF